MQKPQSFQIRLAVAADVDALVNMEQRHFPSDRLSRRSFQSLLRSPSAQVWVIEHTQTIVGNAVVLMRKNSRKARLYSLLIDVSMQSRGLGRKLIQSIKQHLGDRGVREMTLEVRAGDTRAQQFYQQLGFGVIGEKHGYYQDGEDALRMRHCLA